MPYDSGNPKPPRTVFFNYHSPQLILPFNGRRVLLAPLDHLHTGSDVGIHCPMRLVPRFPDGSLGDPIGFDHGFPDLSKPNMLYQFYAIRETPADPPFLIPRPDVTELWKAMRSADLPDVREQHLFCPIKKNYVLIWCDTTMFQTKDYFFVLHYEQKLRELLNGDAWNLKCLRSGNWEHFGMRLTECVALSDRSPLTPLQMERALKEVERRLTQEPAAGSDSSKPPA